MMVTSNAQFFSKENRATGPNKPGPAGRPTNHFFLFNSKSLKKRLVSWDREPG